MWNLLFAVVWFASLGGKLLLSKLMALLDSTAALGLWVRIFCLLFCLPEKILKEYVNIDCFDVTDCVSIDRDKSLLASFSSLLSFESCWRKLGDGQEVGESTCGKAGRCHRKVSCGWEGRW